MPGGRRNKQKNYINLKKIVCRESQKCTQMAPALQLLSRSRRRRRQKKNGCDKIKEGKGDTKQTLKTERKKNKRKSV